MRDEELLERFAAGERSLEDPEITRRRKECPEFRARIQDMIVSKNELDQLSEFRQRVVEKSQDLSVPGAESRAHLIREQLSELGSAAPSRPIGFGRRIGAMAAALAFLTAGAWLAGLFDLREDTTMGTGFELHRPQGAVTAFDEFVWSYKDAGPGWYFRVVVDPEGGERFETLDPLYESEWTPGPETTSSWKRIQWQVVVYDAQGAVIGESSSVSASLR